MPTWMRVTQSVARDAGKDVQGKRATLTPRHAGNVWITKDLGEGFGVGAGLNLVGARFANPGNTVKRSATSRRMPPRGGARGRIRCS